MSAPVWARRRAAAVQAWREFRTNTGGLLGAAFIALLVVFSLLAPLLIDQDGLNVVTATGSPLEPPSGAYWLGTDESGRSVLLLTLWGARVSLLVGFAATLLSVVVGTLVGVVSAHFGGWISAVLMRITDFFLVLPALVLAAVLMAVLPKSMWTVIMAIGVTSWPTTARLVRAQTLSVESRPYIERSKALGGGHTHIIGKHVLPSVLPLVFANTTLVVGGSIIAESTLAFLGMSGPEISWGSMLDRANQSGAVTAGAWWYLLPPGVAIVLVVLSFTLVGRALETVLNPRLKGDR
ncbi:ABC transporter permease [Prauserella halophila]|uniref:ABC transporter permease n=1 Tax=Prauserella halophila TaxID=185641 RepID=A0ABN1VZ75_9PSEU|nr:ABC transporter permease [Prauserella halophila]MCP2237292.1 peptide/nickel transport system permease protein [Prauserella halophila]